MESQLERFKEFLRQNKYSEMAIKAYLKELKAINHFDFTTTKEDCVYFINKAIKDAKKKGISKTYTNNFRAALHQLFLITFGKTAKEYRLQNHSIDYIDIFLDDFLIILLSSNLKPFLLHQLRRLISEIYGVISDLIRLIAFHN